MTNSPSLGSGRLDPFRPLTVAGRLPRLLLLLVLGLSAGCRDSPTDPLAGIVAAETDLASLALELPLASPLSEDGTEPDGAPDAVRRWTRSWEQPVLEGRRIRAGLHAELGWYLARTRPLSALDEQLDVLGAGVRRASSLPLASLPEFLGVGVRRAQDAHHRARRAWEQDSVAVAWAQVMAGSDALREVGPEAVARSVVAELEAALRRIPGGGPYSQEQLERIRHLVRGAAQAVEQGDWGRALRRAFYARRLLAGNG